MIFKSSETVNQVNEENEHEKEIETMGTKLMSKDELKNQLMKDNLKNTKGKQVVENVVPSTVFVLPVENNKQETIQIMNLNTKDLVSSQDYQRDIDQKEVAYIVSNFDPHQFGIIKVSFRDGKYYVYDGQHRIAAFKVLNNNQDGFVKCEVHYGLTYEDEARYFAEQYLGAKKVNIVYRWRALYEAKEEPVYTIVNAVRAIGIDVKFTKSKLPNRIVAFKQLNDMWNKIGSEETLRILTLLKKSWESDVNTFDGNILMGMREFFLAYSDEIVEETFIKQMKKTLPSTIVIEGKKDMLSKDGLNFAKVIWSKYNNGLKSRRLDYKFRG